MNKVYRAHIMLFLVGVFYAVNYLVAKDIMPTYIGASGFIFYRVFGATALFWLVHTFISSEKIQRKDLPRFLIAALFGIAMNQLLFFNGLSLTSPVNASVIMTSNPVLVLLASALILKETITPTRIAGISLGIVGALGLITLPIVLGYSDKEWTDGDPIGDAMILGNALSYGIYLVTVKPLMAKYEAMTVIKWVFTFGCFMVFPFGIEQALEVDWANMPTATIWGVLYVVICVTFLVYFFNVFAMKTVSPSVVSAYIYLQPVLAGSLSILLGYEKLHWIKILAAAFIFTGVYLVSFHKKKAPSAT
ncbi:MAG: DMT family transporter [Salibacteraceae bacterium]|nr:DMT family transporter [Salibacteraceae bacterium]MDP4763565.1 DMT family transporter [Salibacteraceae bacterium]MDP4964899.1 DMT family transporter [Salibacteraceae bacterium]